VPASFGQQRFWLLERLQPRNAANHLQLAVRVRGELDRGRLRAALAAVQARHEPLRIGLAEVAGEVVQVPMADAALPLVETEGGDWAEQLVEDAATAFDFEQGPLWRVRWIKTAAGEQVLGFTFHHAIFDGWSEGVLVRELAAAYAGRLLASPIIGYGDFSAWQRAWLAGGELERQMTYWRAQLADVPALDFPTDRARPAVQTYAGGVRHMTLGQVQAAAVAKLARGEGATLFMVLLAAWEAMLSRHAGQEDFAVGTPIAGRTRTELEGMIGLFLNTLVLRADIAGDPTFAELLGRVRATTLDAYAHQDAPFEQIVEALNPPRDLSRPPLFQTLLVVQNAPVGEAEVAGVKLEALRPEGRTAKYELTLAARERAGDLELSLEFNEALFERATAERLLARFVTLLTTAVAEPKRRVSRLPLLGNLDGLDDGERAQLMAWGHDTALAHDRTATLSSLWAAQVARTPAAVAVIDGERRLTYAEMAARVSVVDHQLREAGIGPEDRVGICLARGAELIVALLGVLQTGAAYVPLDPAYPTERLRFMFGDANLGAVVTQRSTASSLPGHNLPTVWMDALPAGADGALAGPAVPANLAYLIYTSGSTGRPKAAAIEHRQAVALVHWAQATFGPEELAGVLFSTSVCFDLSVFELFVTLASGGTVIVAENALTLPTLAARDEVTLLNTVPSAAAELARQGVMPAGLRSINLAGEVLTAALADQLYEFPGVQRVRDLYGPSEDTTYSTWTQRVRSGRANIGRVIANSRLYLVDEGLQLVPVGAIGEIVLAGEGVARGYLGRPELTAERFVPDPFASEPGGRLYRTGDLARYGSDGHLTYLGRRDHQVKIRGFRVELGEIQARLEAHPGIVETAVLAREHAQRGIYLVAFVVCSTAEKVAVEALADWVKVVVPMHMAPTVWHVLPALPRTLNGKLDRRALPEDAAIAVGTADTVPAEGPVEELVAALWGELLGIETVGRTDNFFELGGHSLLATQLISRLREQLQIELPLMRFFEAPTVAGCARELIGQESAPGQAEQYARARMRLRSMTPEEKAQLLAKADT